MDENDDMHTFSLDHSVVLYQCINGIPLTLFNRYLPVNQMVLFGRC